MLQVSKINPFTFLVNIPTFQNYTYNGVNVIPLTETNELHLKMDGWKTDSSFGFRSIFSCDISFREVNLIKLDCIIQFIPKTTIEHSSHFY